MGPFRKKDVSNRKDPKGPPYSFQIQKRKVKKSTDKDVIEGLMQNVNRENFNYYIDSLLEESPTKGGHRNSSSEEETFNGFCFRDKIRMTQLSSFGAIRISERINQLKKDAGPSCRIKINGVVIHARKLKRKCSRITRRAGITEIRKPDKKSAKAHCKSRISYQRQRGLDKEFQQAKVRDNPGTSQVEDRDEQLPGEDYKKDMGSRSLFPGWTIKQLIISKRVDTIVDLIKKKEKEEEMEMETASKESCSAEEPTSLNKPDSKITSGTSHCLPMPMKRSKYNLRMGKAPNGIKIHNDKIKIGASPRKKESGGLLTSLLQDIVSGQGTSESERSNDGTAGSVLCSSNPSSSSSSSQLKDKIENYTSVTMSPSHVDLEVNSVPLLQASQSMPTLQGSFKSRNDERVINCCTSGFRREVPSILDEVVTCNLETGCTKKSESCTTSLVKIENSAPSTLPLSKNVRKKLSPSQENRFPPNEPNHAGLSSELSSEYSIFHDGSPLIEFPERDTVGSEIPFVSHQIASSFGQLRRVRVMAKEGPFTCLAYYGRGSESEQVKLMMLSSGNDGTAENPITIHD